MLSLDPCYFVQLRHLLRLIRNDESEQLLRNVWFLPSLLALERWLRRRFFETCAAVDVSRPRWRNNVPPNGCASSRCRVSRPSRPQPHPRRPAGTDPRRACRAQALGTASLVGRVQPARLQLAGCTRPTVAANAHAAERSKAAVHRRSALPHHEPPRLESFPRCPAPADDACADARAGAQPNRRWHLVLASTPIICSETLVYIARERP